MIDAHVNTLRTAEGLLGHKGRMLDIGCGRGESLVAASRLGWQAIGVEPSAAFVQEGRREFGLDIVHGTAASLTEPEGTFDLVLLSGVLEHVYDPVRMLRDASRFICPWGLVFVDVPNEASFVQRLARLYFRVRGRDWTAALSPTFPPYHVVGFTARSLRFAFERSALTPLTIRTYPLTFTGSHETAANRFAAWIERGAQVLGGGSGLIAWARRDLSGT